MADFQKRITGHCGNGVGHVYRRRALKKGRKARCRAALTG